MSYVSRTYFGDVIRVSDGATVAPTSDLSNPDYQAFVAWCEAGNEPQVDDTMPPSVPQIVSRRKMLTVLEMRGLLTTIETFVASQSALVQIAWRESNEFQRDNALITQFAASLGMTSADIDSLFIAAAAIG